jgi:hypothetical protein
VPYPKGRAARDATPADIAEFAKGGRLDFAHALIAEGGGRLYAVPSHEYGFHGRRVPWHFLVRRGDLYHDVFGVHSRKEVLDAWSDIAGRRIWGLRLANKGETEHCDRDEERYRRALAMIRAGGT